MSSTTRGRSRIGRSTDRGSIVTASVPGHQAAEPIPDPSPLGGPGSAALLGRAGLVVVAIALLIVAGMQLPASHGGTAPGPAALATRAAAGLTASPRTTPAPGTGTIPVTLPAWATNPVLGLRCKRAVAPIGATIGDGTVNDAPEVLSPREALNAFLAGPGLDVATLPLAGYSFVANQPTWAALAHQVDGRIVALFVVRRVVGDRWSVARFAACDAAEFQDGTPLSGGVTLWTDAGGQPVPAATLVEQTDCYDGTQLRLDGRLYVRDPSGGAYDPETLQGVYAGDAELPADAVDTGYRQGARRLFREAGDAAVYVVSPQRVERWPRVIGDQVVRIDCN
jgi:hypothetical protein